MFLWWGLGVAGTSTLILTGFWLYQQYSYHQQELVNFEQEYLEARKLELKNQVEWVLNYISFQRTRAEERLKREIRSRTDEAHAIAQHLYDTYRHTRSPDDLKKMIIEALRPIRFNQGRGYFFATSLQGVEQLFADHPEMEGKNLWSLQDAHGAYVIRDMAKLARTQGEGFYQYFWTKPNTPGRNFPKIAFIKYFTPFDWFIGTGEYLDDVERDIQQEVLTWANSLALTDDFYILIHTYKGLCLAHHDKTRIGVDMWEHTDSQGVKVTQESVLLSRLPQGGFLEYVGTIRPSTGQPGRKLSYFRSLPEWEWAIGAGLYTDSLKNFIDHRKTELRAELRQNIGRTLSILISLVALTLGLAMVAAHRVRDNIAAFQAFFAQAATHSPQISSDSLEFREFQELAAAVNNMVAARQLVEEALQQSKTRLELTLEAAHMGTWDWDLRSHEVIIDKGHAALFGIRWEDFGGTIKDVEQVVHPDDLGTGWHALKKVTDQGGAYENTYRVVWPDGTLRWLHSYGKLLRDAQGQPRRLLGITRDITEQKIMLDALRDSEHLFSQIFQLSPEMIGIFRRRDGSFLMVNDALVNNLGYDRTEVIGHTARELGLFVHPEDLEKLVGRLPRDGVVRNQEIMIRKKNGEFLPIMFSMAPLEIRGEHCVVTVGVDISERRQAEEEREKLASHLRQTQKLEAIGRLAGGIAHDFNNILAAIMGNTELALLDAGDSGVQRHLEQVLTASQRARDLVRQILAFSRQQDGEEGQPAVMAAALVEGLQLLRASLPATIDIRAAIDSLDALVPLGPIQIHQVLVNLCTNAAYALRETGGVIEVSLRQVVLGAAEAARHPELAPGPYLELTVADNGPGIDPAIQDHIFDPYFTTKDIGEGSGLGLAVVHGIVKRHRGAVAVVSSPGHGTTFTVLLPQVSSALPPEEKLDSPIPPGQERILFVDDERVLTEVYEKILSSLGYAVTTAASGEEGLQRFAAHPEAFDLVITDYTMPRLTGLDLAREVRRLREDIPIILCTGYSEDVDEDKARASGIQKLVLKPLSRRRFAQVIRGVLDGGPDGLHETGAPVAAV